MLISMKPNQREREKLARRIKRARTKSHLSTAEIAARASVDPGQTSRILEGDFRTISANVVQICKVLGFDPHDGSVAVPTRAQATRNAAWARLEDAVRRAWDKTPQGAERLANVIDAVGRIGTR